MTRNLRFFIASAALAIAAPLLAQGGSAAAVVIAPDSGAATVSMVPATAPQATNASPVLAVASTPTLANAAAGVRIHADAAPLNAPLPRERVDRNPALMIVGGVALVAGSIIGGRTGTIIMVGGAVVGLVGLWNYLQ